MQTEKILYHQNQWRTACVGQKVKKIEQKKVPIWPTQSAEKFGSLGALGVNSTTGNLLVLVIPVYQLRQTHSPWVRTATLIVCPVPFGNDTCNIITWIQKPKDLTIAATTK